MPHAYSVPDCTARHAVHIGGPCVHRCKPSQLLQLLFIQLTGEILCGQSVSVFNFQKLNWQEKRHKNTFYYKIFSPDVVMHASMNICSRELMLTVTFQAHLCCAWFFSSSVCSVSSQMMPSALLCWPLLSGIQSCRWSCKHKNFFTVANCSQQTFLS